MWYLNKQKAARIHPGLTYEVKAKGGLGTSGWVRGYT